MRLNLFSETERGGVISLLSSHNIPDNLSEIGVEYVEVSYFITLFILNYMSLFFFFLFSFFLVL